MTAELVLHSRRVLTPAGVAEADIAVEQGIIAGLSAPGEAQAARRVDLRDAWVIPGLIDTHVHGGVGFNFMEAGSKELQAICSFHARHGTTGLLATTGAASDSKTEDAITRLARYIQGGSYEGASVLGIHLEGPFLAQARRGAQDPEYIQEPVPAKMERWLTLGDGLIRLVTLAPERPRAMETIRLLTEAGVCTAAGHTDATYEEMAQAALAGLRHTIHTFNGMRGLHHREPGVAGAAMDLDELTAEVVADGYHVHPAVIRLLFRVKGPAGMTLVTDAVDPAGLDDGEYRWQGRTVRVRQGKVELADGSSLAGSTLTMIGAVRNAMKFCRTDLATAVRMASLEPARLIRLDRRKGSIEPGKDADLVVLDDALEVQATMVGGRFVYQRA